MLTIKETLPFQYGLFSNGEFVGPLKQTPFPSQQAISKAEALCTCEGAEKTITEHVSFVGDIHRVSETELAILTVNRVLRDSNIRYYIQQEV